MFIHECSAGCERCSALRPKPPDSRRGDGCRSVTADGEPIARNPRHDCSTRRHRRPRRTVRPRWMTNDSVCMRPRESRQRPCPCIRRCPVPRQPQLAKSLDLAVDQAVAASLPRIPRPNRSPCAAVTGCANVRLLPRAGAGPATATLAWKGMDAKRPSHATGIAGDQTVIPRCG